MNTINGNRDMKPDAERVDLEAFCRLTVMQWASRRGLAVDQSDVDDLIGPDASSSHSAGGASPPTNSRVESDGTRSGDPAPTRTTSRTIDTILDAAIRIFINDGFHVNVNDIACEAGVTKPTIYTYFKSKQDLFVAAVTKASTELVPRMPPQGDAEDIYGDLYDYARIYRDISLGDTGLKLFRLLLSNIPALPSLARDVGEKVMNEMTDSMSAYFRGAIDAGKIAPLDPQFLALQFFAIADGHTRTWKLLGLPSPQRDDSAYLQQSIACFVRGIRVGEG